MKYTSVQGKQQQFLNEFRQLLSQYQAEILIEDFGTGYLSDEKMVIDFAWDEALKGRPPRIVLGKWEDGKTT